MTRDPIADWCARRRDRDRRADARRWLAGLVTAGLALAVIGVVAVAPDRLGDAAWVCLAVASAAHWVAVLWPRNG